MRPRLKKSFVLGSVFFASLSYHYFSGALLAIRSTFDYQLLPSDVTRALYTIEVLAVVTAIIVGIAFVRSLVGLDEHGA